MTDNLLVESAVQRITAALWADSHGASGRFFGAGHLYYALASVVRSQVSVCIGSGAGFVPTIMSQAQNDIGIENARTFLVDANLPDLAFGSPSQAGGWMTAENEFLATAQRVTVLNMLSTDAAALFAREGIRIDYLHIDGDHSRRGVLADLEDYLPLLSAGAVVSLHDLRADGVRMALDDALIRFPALERLSFFELGAGTAIVRLRSDTIPPRLGLTVDPGFDAERKTAIAADVVAEAIPASQEKAKYERWHYMATGAYRLRYDLIAREIDRPETTIVELGGFPNSVVDVLQHAPRIVALEPYAPDAYVKRLEALAAARGASFRVIRETLSGGTPLPMSLGRYVLVAMGLDLSQGCTSHTDFAETIERLIDLVAGAETVAIELADYAHSKVVYSAIQACITMEIIHDVRLDLSSDPVAEEFHVKDARAQRRVILFRPKEALPVGLRAALLKSFVDELYFLKQASAEPETRTYRLGDPIEFRRGGEMQRYLLKGWAVAERAKTWMVDQSSSLLLQVEGESGDTASVPLSLAVMPFIVPGKLDQQRLAIAINGETLYEAALTAPATIDIAVPRALLDLRKPALMELFHPDAMRPKHLIEGNDDGRMLSIALTSLRLGIGK